MSRTSSLKKDERNLIFVRFAVVVVGKGDILETSSRKLFKDVCQAFNFFSMMQCLGVLKSELQERRAEAFSHTRQSALK